MKKIRLIMRQCLFYVSMLLLITSVAEAQQSSMKVTGTVKDSKGLPLVGVTVQVKNNVTNGVSTNLQGEFSITTAPTAVLVFSYVGFQGKEVPVANNRVLTVQLNGGNQSLNEVVVVAYGTQRRSATTAAISTVKGAELATAPVANISSSLTGRVAGISMRPNGGQPGFDNPDLHVRGYCNNG